MNYKKNYIVSAIIPTYNAGPRLKKCIESIINQSLGIENIELIIIDDNSTDKITKETIKKYQSQYPQNIKTIFLNKNSGGPGKPRNIALKHTTTNYIIYADQDDYYLKDGFQTLYQSITQYNSDMIMCNRYSQYHGKKHKNMRQLQKNLINISPFQNQKYFNLLFQINIGLCWANIYKKEFLIKNNIKFLENAYAEDTFFYIQVLKYSQKITILPQKIVYVYNIHDQSTCHSHSKKFITKAMKGWDQINNFLKNTNINIDQLLTRQTELFLMDFSLADNQIKKELIKKIYQHETKLIKEFNFNTHLSRIELNILNKAILNKKFSKAILISNIYKKLYTNTLIQKIYKKIRKT